MRGPGRKCSLEDLPRLGNLLERELFKQEKREYTIEGHAANTVWIHRGERLSDERSIADAPVIQQRGVFHGLSLISRSKRVDDAQHIRRHYCGRHVSTSTIWATDCSFTLRAEFLCRFQCLVPVKRRKLWAVQSERATTKACIGARGRAVRCRNASSNTTGVESHKVEVRPDNGD